MGKLCKRLVSIITTAIITAGLTLTSVPAYEATAATVTTGIGNYDNGVLQILNNDEVEYYGAKDYGLAERVQDGAILHAWCWSFNTIKQNLKDIAEAGFTTVQTSPANECLVGENGGLNIWSESGGGKWEYHYQPTDWKIGNYQLGTRDEFKAMCDEAEKYGISIIVDVLPNHTTPQVGQVAQSMKDAAGGQDKLYHGQGFASIGNNQWEDRYYCTNGAVLGLPDVNTENPGFQKYYLNYLNDLIDCGVDGFRYDTAKHIGLPDDPQDPKTIQYGWRNNFFPVALGQESVDGVTLHNKDSLFIYGEVLQSAGSRDSEYAKYLHLTASNYGFTLRGAIGSKDFSTGRISNWSTSADPSKLVTWVESHDTYCNEHISANINSWQIRMCWAIIAARKDGTPLFYSRPDGSNGWSNLWGNNKIGAKGDDNFKHPEVAAVNKFRNAMAGESEYLRNINGSSQVLSIERGNKGQVIINLGGELTISNHETKLKDGSYVDQVSGSTFTVSGGKISGKVGSGTIAVLYDAKPIESISATPGSSTFKGDSITVTLNATNISNATYSIDGGAAVSYTSGTKVVLGANTAPGGTVKLTLKGTNSSGESLTETYTYTKKDSTYKAGYLYATKPSGWGSNMYAYVYSGDGTTAKTLQKWPGVKMTGDGTEFEYELPAEWQNSKTQVIFNDGGTNQYPAAEKPGEFFAENHAMEFAEGNITVIPVSVTTPLTLGSNALTLSSSSVEVGDSVTITTAAATGGTGTINYQFDVDGDVIKSYSTSKNTTWKPTSAGTYTIKVTAKDEKGTIVSATKTLKVTEPLSDLSLTTYKTNLSSPQNVGTSITLTAGATGGSGTKKYSFDVEKNGVSTFTRAYSSSTTATWTPDEAGTYTIYFRVQDGNGNEDQKSIQFTIVKTDELSITSYKTNVASPQALGTSVTLTAAATGGSGTKEYRFVAQKDGKTTFAQGYSTKTTAIWKPTEAGSYSLTFKVKDSTGKEVVKTMRYEIKSSLTLTTAKTSVASPQVLGTTVTMTAGATGGSGTKQYRFVAQKDGKTTFSQGYSTKTTATWKATEAGTYTLFFKVKDGTGKEIVKTIKYEIKSPLTLTTAKTSAASPQVLGTTVTMTAGATGGSGTKQYRFVAQKDGKTTFSQGYSTKTTATWKATEAGTYTLFFKVKDGTGKEIAKTIKYEIKSPLTLTTAKTSVASPQKAGTSITLTIGATGGSGTKQYRFAVQKNNKTVYSQGYSTKTTATWKPTEAGTYTIFFKVKDGTGKEISKSLVYKIEENKLAISSYKVSTNSPAEVGTSIKLTSTATGGNGTIQYRFVVQKDGKNTFAQGYSTSSTATWTPKEEGTYTIFFKAKVGEEKEICKSMTYVITEKKYVNISSVTTNLQSPQEIDTVIKITAKATAVNGGTIKYKFMVHEGTNGWKTIKNSSTTNYANWTTSKKGICNIMVEATDEYGNKAIEIIQFTVI